MAGETPVYFDGLSAFPLGIDSGVAPLLLPRDRLSFAINSTVRGSYITHRPAFRKIALEFDTSVANQAVFEDQGLWQGGSFFKSEYGTEAMVVSIGGHLFQVRPDDLGGAVVTDVSIVGDLNNSGTAIAWLWQAERWIIVQNGVQLPIFFDGQTTRRSFGPTQVIGTTAVDWAVPAVGGNVNVTLTGNYTGPFNTTVLVDDVFYQVNSSVLGYEVTLKNLSESAGTTVVNGTPVIIPANLVDVTIAPSQRVSGINVRLFFPPPLDPPIVAPFGGEVISIHVPDSGEAYQTFPLVARDNAAGTIDVFDPFTGQPSTGQFPIYSAAYRGYFTAASTIGQLSQSFVTPAVGASISAFLTMPYNGTVPQKVVINGGVYQITATNNTPVASNVINITNISDDPTATPMRGPGTPTTPGIFHTVPEMTIGKMGAYGMGRNFYSLADGRSYRATDLVGSDSGSPSVQNRDAVLRETENTFLTSGDFVIPGNIGDITSMTFTANLDTSLGQGPLQVGTSETIFSCNAPIDVSIWQLLTNPIQTVSLKGNGPLGQSSTINVNSDTLFRTRIGWGSLILARREFATWGNTPISHEVERIVVQDNRALLKFGSSIDFSNRFLSTTKPIQSQAGVFHQGMVALDFAPISNLGEKSPSVYDGLWTGVNTLQIITGTFSNRPRAFAFSYNTSANKIELYEILTDDEAEADSNDPEADDIPITWQFETACLLKEVKNKGQFDLAKLIDGEIYVAEVSGRVRFEVFYRNQFDPCWHLWTDFSICAIRDPDNIDVRRQNRVSLGLGKPDPANSCDPANKRPFFTGENFQLKFRITGHCKYYGGMLKAAPEPKGFFTQPVCGEQQCRLQECPPDNDYGVYSLQDRFLPEPITVFFNQQVQFCKSCPEGQSAEFTGSLPTWITFDEDTGCLIGAPGVYSASTQLEANTAAQNALNEFGEVALQSGDLDCAEPSNICVDGVGSLLTNCYSITGYSDGTIDNPISAPFAGVAWDGTFKFNNGVSIWGGRNPSDGLDLTIDGGGPLCNPTLSFEGCVDDVPQWQLAVTTDVNLWTGIKSGGNTPEGVYTNNLSGADALPATLTIGLIAGTSTTLGTLSCGS